MISVICPIYNEESRIEACIQSIIAQDFPHEEMEVLFVDGMSTDRTRVIVGSYSQQYPFIRLLDNPMHTAPVALNRGIRAAKGDIIVRLDAHSKYPSDYFSVLVNKLQSTDADNVGGVCNTLPAKDTSVCRAIAYAMSSSFGMGNSHFRVGVDREKWVDTVPFGCFHRDIFDKIGFFDEELVRNQDDEFNGRLENLGGKIYLIPQVIINYTARDTLCKMRRMYYQYGLYKPLVNKKLGAPATVRQFFPLFFLLFLVFGGIGCLFSPLVQQVYVGILLLYLFIGLVVGGMSAIRMHQPLLILLMPYVFLNIHLSYGLGYLTGSFNVMRKKTTRVTSNR